MRSRSDALAWLPTLAGLTLLAACGQGLRLSSGPPPPPRGPVSDSPVKIGKPYQVAGIWYAPADDRGYDEVGYASWYGDAFHGGATANGERFDMAMVSAAHKTLPLPCYVEVTALDSGRTIVLRVNDRGPFVSNRIIDLSRRAAEMLGIADKGVARVRVRRVDPPEPDRLALRSGRAAAERRTVDGPMLAVLDRRFQQWFAAQAPVAARPSLDTTLAAGAIGGYYVQVAAYGDRTRADSLAATLGASIESARSLHRVRMGPFFDEAIALAALARIQGDGYQDARLIRPMAGN